MNKPFDFYVLTPIILTIGGVEYKIEISLFGDFKTENNVPFVPVPSKFIVEKITKNGREMTDDKTVELVDKFTTKFFKENPEKFRKLVLEELESFGHLFVKTELTNVGIKNKV